ncbi:DUF4401 domain-containing protein [Pedobacter heparinus]|uniref:DUF4401 domain-containing protein n=1 Tax=Pedobacter heparinus TaxID=984 RepID=UPI002930C218|nr:DUF4401 domain-containing protein [Pedobacter heparinus]
MPLNPNTESIIEKLQAEYNGTIVFQERQMEEALAVEANKYQGLGIKALSVVGGFLSSSFFIGFVAMMISNWSEALLASGLLMILGTVWIDRASKSVIMDTISISAYLSANLMIGMAMYQITKSDNMVAVLLLAISLTVPFLTPSYMLNFLSVLMIHGCLFALLNVNGGKELMHLFLLLPAAGFTLLSLYEPRLLTQGAAVNIRFNPWRTGMLFSLMASLCYSGTVLFGDAGPNWVQVLALPIWGSLLIIFVSFHTGHRTGLAAGILLLIYAVGQYYYNLHFTLLVKSYMMLGTGVLFLIAWFIFKNKLKQEHEQD